MTVNRCVPWPVFSLTTLPTLRVTDSPTDAACTLVDSASETLSLVISSFASAWAASLRSSAVMPGMRMTLPVLAVSSVLSDEDADAPTEPSLSAVPATSCVAETKSLFVVSSVSLTSRRLNVVSVPFASMTLAFEMVASYWPSSFTVTSETVVGADDADAPLSVSASALSVTAAGLDTAALVFVPASAVPSGSPVSSMAAVRTAAPTRVKNFRFIPDFLLPYFLLLRLPLRRLWLLPSVCGRHRPKGRWQRRPRRQGQARASSRRRS